MARIKRSVSGRKKRRTILEKASGYRGSRGRLYRSAREQVLHSGRYAFNDRRKRKGDFRKLWIARINAAARSHGLSYNRFMNGLKLAEIEIDRRVLSDMAINDPSGFASIVTSAKAGLEKAGLPTTSASASAAPTAVEAADVAAEETPAQA